MRAFMRFFFHHFYHAFAWTYDFVAALVSVGRWNAWTRTAIPHLTGRRILEIGHGPGHLQLTLRQRGLTVFGLDESRQMGRLACERLTRAGLPVALTRGYAQTLPFGADCFDSVVATFPSEYISDPRTLAEVWRVLRPGGRLVVVPVAYMGSQAWPDRAANWLFRVTGQNADLTADLRAKIKARFTEADFQVSLNEVEVRQSVVFVIVAEKTG
jgi:ubiquinone/menaquinone biosynthesis C-methylase UbiE